jgi:hypothetical protein
MNKDEQQENSETLGLKDMADLPVTIRKVIKINNDQYFPEFAESDFYKDNKFYCIEYYKPISQVSKLI